MSKCALCKTSLKDDEINVCDKCRLDFLNFKQQLSEKDKKIERLTSPCEYFINYNNHIVRKLPLGEEEVLLTPKEICDLLNGYVHEFMDSRERYAEWKRHKLSQYNSKKNYVRQVVEKELRKQVCDEIKIALTSTEPNCSIADLDSDLYEFSGREICVVLDQIEQGEQQ